MASKYLIDYMKQNHNAEINQFTITNHRGKFPRHTLFSAPGETPQLWTLSEASELYKKTLNSLAPFDEIVKMTANQIAKECYKLLNHNAEKYWALDKDTHYLATLVNACANDEIIIKSRMQYRMIRFYQWLLEQNK